MILSLTVTVALYFRKIYHSELLYVCNHFIADYVMISTYWPSLHSSPPNIILTVQMQKHMDGTHQLFACSLTGDPALHFIWCIKKYKSGARSIQPPVPFCPPITMSFMQLTTQLIHCHILICIIICYKPKGNVIFLSELKSDFISIETPWSGVNCHHFISYERPILCKWKDSQLHILFGCTLLQDPGRRSTGLQVQVKMVFIWE